MIYLEMDFYSLYCKLKEKLNLRLQGKKQSLSFYYGTYLEKYILFLNFSKETLKQLRLKLHLIENTQYDIIKSIVTKTNDFTIQIVDLRIGKDKFLESLNMDHDVFVSSQRLEIIQLQKKVEELEDTLDDLNVQIETTIQFQESDGLSGLQEEIDAIKLEAEIAKEKRKKQLEKISSKYEQSLFLSTKKVQKIISEIESVACKVRYLN